MFRIAGKASAALLIACCLSAAAAAAPPADIWYHDVDAAWAKAKQSNRPLVLFFTTDGCLFCDKMILETYKDAAVAKELSAGFVPVLVHAKKHPMLVQKIGVRAFPTTVIISKDAKIIAAMPGYVNVAQMRESLRVARIDSAPRR